MPALAVVSCVFFFLAWYISPKQLAARALARAERDRQAAELRHRIAAVKQICSDAQSAAALLPMNLEAANEAMERAEPFLNGPELHSQRYSPFKKEFGAATVELQAFDRNLRHVADLLTAYDDERRTLRGAVPVFSFGNADIPDPEPTYDRHHALYLAANQEFTTIGAQHSSMITASADAKRAAVTRSALLGRILSAYGAAARLRLSERMRSKPQAGPMTQRDKLRELAARHGSGTAALIHAYAAAERRREVKRLSNDYNISSEAYARALVSDARRKGWL